MTGFWRFDDAIDLALRMQHVPERFVVTSERMAACVESETLFERVRVAGHAGTLLKWWPEEHPDVCPLVEIADEAGRPALARQLGKEAYLGMRAEAKARGVTHYRDIPIVVDDSQTAFRLISHPWGEPE